MQKHERAIKKLKDELALLLEEIKNMQARINQLERCLLYTSDAADD